MNTTKGCVKRESNQIYVFVFCRKCGRSTKTSCMERCWRRGYQYFLGEFDCYGSCQERINAKLLGSWRDCQKLLSLEHTWDVTLFRVSCQICKCQMRTLDVQRNNPHHDPLFKVCPFMDMVKKNFKRCYKPGRDLSFDKGYCPFKDRLKFRCYNPRKPAKFHIKMFEVSDSKTGYVIGFDVYTGKKKQTVTKEHKLWTQNVQIQLKLL